MNREIKFRGKSNTGDGSWYVGHLVCDEQNIPLIIPCEVQWMDNTEFKIKDFHSVYPETVGQFTGLKDKNGVEIYEGDIVKTYSLDEGELTERVIFADGCFKFSAESKLDWPIVDYKFDYIEVIGSIHDNQKGGDNES